MGSDLSVPDHCLSFYFSREGARKQPIVYSNQADQN